MTDKYVKYLRNLPVIPEVAAKILSIAENKLDISFKELENIIKMDPGLTAKILKIANSALYARQREITSLQMAITLLGFKNIKSLVLLVTASNTFARFKKTEFYQEFWKNSILTAFAAKRIALRTGKKDQAEEVFLAALLHHIGQVAFFNVDQEQYQQLYYRAREESRPIEIFEKETFGLDYRELGASILQEWNFPELYVDVAREHKSENVTSRHKALIMIVSVAALAVEIYLLDHHSQAQEELLARIIPYTDLTESDLSYYRDHFMQDLRDDDLFQECQELFGIKS